MIQSFRHKGLKRLYEDDDPRGVMAEHLTKLRNILARLDAAGSAEDMDLPGFNLHALKGRWQGFMAVFILINCWSGLTHARALARIAKLPRREGFACPDCKVAPPCGEIWRCGKCGEKFDTFATQGVCPHCQNQFTTPQCTECGASRPIQEWIIAPASNN